MFRAKIIANTMGYILSKAMGYICKTMGFIQKVYGIYGTETIGYIGLRV